jgi:hypothetical protein
VRRPHINTRSPPPPASAPANPRPALCRARLPACGHVSRQRGGRAGAGACRRSVDSRLLTWRDVRRNNPFVARCYKCNWPGKPGETCPNCSGNGDVVQLPKPARSSFGGWGSSSDNKKGDFVCEYAKSGRSKCHGTGEFIPKDELRIGIMGEHRGPWPMQPARHQADNIIVTYMSWRRWMRDRQPRPDHSGMHTGRLFSRRLK